MCRQRRRRLRKATQLHAREHHRRSQTLPPWLPAGQFTRQGTVGCDRLRPRRRPQPRPLPPPVSRKHRPQIHERSARERHFEHVFGRGDGRVALIDEQRGPSHAACALGLEREFCITPGGPARSRQFEIRQAGRDLGMGCRGGRHPREIDPSTGRAGKLHALEFEHLTRLGHELVEVQCPLHSR